MKHKLFSIGYNGFSVEEFISILICNEVKCLIDTREVPISRKKGFSKSALRNLLVEAGVEYHHFRWLGSPRSDRHDVRVTGDYVKFFSRVRRHLTNVHARKALADVVEIAQTKTSCLMCCCADWKLCHRSCVIDAIAKPMYFSVEHLTTLHNGVGPRKAA